MFFDIREELLGGGVMGGTGSFAVLYFFIYRRSASMVNSDES